jgi:hypothetical protein
VNARRMLGTVQDGPTFVVWCPDGSAVAAASFVASRILRKSTHRRLGTGVPLRRLWGSLLLASSVPEALLRGAEPWRCRCCAERKMCAFYAAAGVIAVCLPGRGSESVSPSVAARPLAFQRVAPGGHNLPLERTLQGCPHDESTSVGTQPLPRDWIQSDGLHQKPCGASICSWAPKCKLWCRSWSRTPTSVIAAHISRVRC